MVLQHIDLGDAAQRVVLPRRGFLKGLIGLIAAPAVVRAEALMPIVVWKPTFWETHVPGHTGTYITCDKDDFLGVDPESLGLEKLKDWRSDFGEFNTYQWYWSEDIAILPAHKAYVL
jgi:hypothetical protein